MFAGIVMAAGRGSRMGANKMLAEVDGRPMVALAAEAALAAGLAPVVVVTGFDAAMVEAALPFGTMVVRNHDPGRGMASSLVAGLAVLPDEVRAVVILLGDMPRVAGRHVLRLLDAFRPGAICVPVHGGRRGNPVLFDREYFAEMAGLEGDRGGRTLLDRHAARLVEVAMDDDAVLKDVDTPEDLRRLSFPSPSGGRCPKGG